MDTYLPISPPPGAWRNGSRYEASGRWYDVNLIRWTNGRLRPIGGWQLFSAAPLTSPARALHAWRANNQTRWLGVGTADKLYAHDGGTLVDITPLGFVAGRDNSVYGLGWGAGLYGTAAYGTQRATSGIVLEAATWSFDNFGEVLIGTSTADGRIYEWSSSQFSQTEPNQRAKALVSAPVDVLGAFVTQERSVVALGTSNNPRTVSWSSRENRYDWIDTVTNTAGSFDIVTPGKLVRGLRTRNANLIFTDHDVHLMRFVGGKFVYGFERLGVGGLVGPNAVTDLDDKAVWMGPDAFWSYDGVVRQIPSDVHEYVFRDFNVLQGAKVACGTCMQFGEVWWFYPSASAVENDRYVIWNYREGWWSYGQLARTAWIDQAIWPHIVACDTTGNLFQHEQGWTDNGKTRVGTIYAETGGLELGNGERFTEVRQLIPDSQDNGQFSLTFKLRENPRSNPFAVAGPYTFTQDNGYGDARFAARQIEMRLDAVVDDVFHLGKLRADTTQGSGR